MTSNTCNFMGKYFTQVDVVRMKWFFLDTKIIATPISEKQVVITTDIYSKKTDTHQYLNPNSCHPKSQIMSIPIGVADRIRRNCSDNVIKIVLIGKS